MWLAKVLFSLLCSCFVIFILLCFFEKKEIVAKQYNFKTEKPLELNLAIAPYKFEIDNSSLQKELKGFFIGRKPNSVKTLFSLLLGEEEKKCEINEELFLILIDESHFAFTNEKTDLWMRVVSVNESLAQAELFFKGERRASLQIGMEEKIEQIDTLSPFAVLSSFTWLKPNIFLEMYGDAEDKKLGQKCRIGKSYFCYVNEGALLLFEEGMWKNYVPEKDMEHVPIALIKKIGEEVMEIEIWNEEKRGRILLKRKNSPLLNFKEFIFSPRLRTLDSVSALFDKQHLNLRRGEIVMKKETWVKVSKKQLLQPIDCEVFVFDGITNLNGKKVMHGYLFDADMSQRVKVDIPLKMVREKRIERKRKVI